MVDQLSDTFKQDEETHTPGKPLGPHSYLLKKTNIENNIIFALEEAKIIFFLRIDFEVAKQLEKEKERFEKAIHHIDGISKLVEIMKEMENTETKIKLSQK